MAANGDYQHSGSPRRFFDEQLGELKALMQNPYQAATARDRISVLLMNQNMPIYHRAHFHLLMTVHYSPNRSYYARGAQALIRRMLEEAPHMVEYQQMMRFANLRADVEHDAQPSNDRRHHSTREKKQAAGPINNPRVPTEKLDSVQKLINEDKHTSAKHIFAINNKGPTQNIDGSGQTGDRKRSSGELAETVDLMATKKIRGGTVSAAKPCTGKEPQQVKVRLKVAPARGVKPASAKEVKPPSVGTRKSARQAGKPPTEDDSKCEGNDEYTDKKATKVLMRGARIDQNGPSKTSSDEEKDHGESEDMKEGPETGGLWKTDGSCQTNAIEIVDD